MLREEVEELCVHACPRALELDVQLSKRALEVVAAQHKDARWLPS